MYCWLQAEEQKRRAEADKLAALTALEMRSKEFLQEKEEKRALEAKIRAMQVCCTILCIVLKRRCMLAIITMNDQLKRSSTFLSAVG